MIDHPKLMSVRHWEQQNNWADASPRCPKCDSHLGIRRAMWTEKGVDTWLCDKCGEIEA